MTPWRSLVIELWISGGLGDSRGAESGVSWTRFDSHPTLTVAICQMQDIFCKRKSEVLGFGLAVLRSWVFGSLHFELCTLLFQLDVEKTN
jgi:hypothetical protein